MVKGGVLGSWDLSEPSLGITWLKKALVGAERIFSEENPGSSVPVSGSVHAYIKRGLIQHKGSQNKET